MEGSYIGSGSARRQILCRASAMCDADWFRSLMAFDMTMDSGDLDGYHSNTLLRFTADLGMARSSQDILESGAGINTKNEYGLMPLHLAVASGDTQLVGSLLKLGADINAPDIQQATPLHWAAKEGRMECLKLLLQHQAEVDARDVSKETPLHWAARRGNVECTNVLLQAGGCVNITNTYSTTPLDGALFSGKVECVRLLLRAGAKVNGGKEYELKPLHIAAELGHHECVKDLLLAGSHVNALDRGKKTALYRAVRNGHLGCVHLLLKAGAMVDHINTDNKYAVSPLFTAIDSGNVECIKLLIQFGASVNALDGRGGTPLHRATRQGSVECCKLLLASGAQDITDTSGDTPVTLAVRSNNRHLLKLFITWNFDVNVTSVSLHLQPLSVALSSVQEQNHRITSHRLEMADMLLTAGARTHVLHELLSHLDAAMDPPMNSHLREQLTEWIISRRGRIYSLFHLSRLVVRDVLRSNPQPFHMSVQSLPLPTIIQNVITDMLCIS